MKVASETARRYTAFLAGRWFDISTVCPYFWFGFFAGFFVWLAGWLLGLLVGVFCLESLILAQDERWRRA
jgi:hypothetical protein